jgi:hypothetical protein
MFRPEALLLAEYMGTNRIYVTESVEWPGRPIVKLKNLTVVGRKDGDITLDGKWLLEKESSGSFENITFKNGQAHCHFISLFNLTVVLCLTVVILAGTSTCLQLKGARWDFLNCNFRSARSAVLLF